MPEGDTVWRTARSLDAALTGYELTRTDLRVPQLATVDLTGERVESVVSAGKHLLLRIGDYSLHNHLGMDGAWHIYRPGARWTKPAHQARVVLAVPDRVAVGFSLRRLELVPRRREEQLLAHLGPDLLGPRWNAAEAVLNLQQDPGRTIGTALLDQANLAGVGNVYRSELCFVSGIHPQLPVGAVPALARLVDRAHSILSANRDRVRRCTTGDPRSGQELWVYGRRGQPCRRCGATVRGATDDGERARHFYWCPHCQPAPDGGQGSGRR